MSSFPILFVAEWVYAYGTLRYIQYMYGHFPACSLRESCANRPLRLLLLLLLLSRS